MSDSLSESPPLPLPPFCSRLGQPLSPSPSSQLQAPSESRRRTPQCGMNPAARRRLGLSEAGPGPSSCVCLRPRERNLCSSAQRGEARPAARGPARRSCV